jgi:hypothetical protein
MGGTSANFGGSVRILVGIWAWLLLGVGPCEEPGWLYCSSVLKGGLDGGLDCWTTRKRVYR